MNTKSVLQALPYPWQTAQWESLTKRYRAQRFPHAILLSGIEGLGKADFARAFASALQCEDPTAEFHACGQCTACLLLLAGTHPDFVVLTPEEKGKSIKVDQIRELTQTVYQHSQRGRYITVIVEPAEAMNAAAANALLKTLEEPLAHVILFLVSHRSALLSPTIRSRCQRVLFPPVQDSVQTAAWFTSRGHADLDIALLMHLAQGAPLKAERIADPEWLAQRAEWLQGFLSLVDGKVDNLSLAKRYEEAPTADLLSQLLLCTMDVIRFQLTQNERTICNQDFSQLIVAVSRRMRLSKLYAFYDTLLDMLRCVSGAHHFNQLLAYESLLGQWKEGSKHE